MRALEFAFGRRPTNTQKGVFVFSSCLFSFFFFFVHNSRNKAGREATFSAGGRVKIRENERRFGSVQQLNGSLKRRHAPA